MRRMLIAVVLVALLGACSTAGEEEGGQGPVVWPSGEAQLVASYSFESGFIHPAYELIQPARILVYSDGRAIADASRTLILTANEVSDLVLALRRDLAGLGPSVQSEEARQIMDAETSVIKVRDAELKLQSVSAYALGDGHPKRLLAARDRLKSLAERVVRDGGPYSTNRVRLVVYPHPENEFYSGEIMPWPATVEVPSAADLGSFGYLGVRSIDLTGEAAAAAAAAMPGGSEAERFARVLKTDSGQMYRVAWRYLVPDE